MNDLLEVLEKVAELLYQERKNDAYGILVKCLPVMGVCIGEIEDKVLQVEIKASLKDVVGGMVAKDCTLLADILQYDIIDKLRGIGEE